MALVHMCRSAWPHGCCQGYCVAVTATATCAPTQPPGPEKRVVGVVLGDDQPVRRRGLRMLLADDADLAVIGDAHDHEELLAACQQLSPDLVLVDANLPELGGLETTRALRDANPQIKVVIFGHDGALF